MKKLLKYLFLFTALAGCVQDDEQEYIGHKPTALVYEYYQKAIVPGMDWESNTPYVRGEGPFHFELVNVTFSGIAPEMAMEDLFSINESGNVFFSAAEDHALGQYTLDIAVENEHGRLVKEEAIQFEVVEYVPMEIIINGGDQSPIEVELGEDGIPMHPVVEGFSVETVGFNKNQLKVNPEDQFEIDYLGELSLIADRYELGSQSVEVYFTISEEEKISSSIEINFIKRATEEWKSLFVYDYTLGGESGQQRGLTALNVGGFEAEMIFGPEMPNPESNFWWNFTKDAGNPNPDWTNEYPLAKLVGNNFATGEGSQSQHILASPEFEGANLLDIQIEGGIFISTSVMNNVDQDFEIFMVKASDFSVSSAPSESWLSIAHMNDLSPNTNGGSHFAFSLEAPEGFVQENFHIVVVLKHGRETASNTGFMAVDNFEISGLYNLIAE
ncbi:hypothetical protein [Persicobacter diffluens]|uniref:Uncharacterized protein n=1 Tax=Persicobacter diffluens TaxID=981 RepID=A0AAN4W0L5_9BACT|nr:hypothetical protein PEDI_40460 [Persicobacter diffluens]